MDEGHGTWSETPREQRFRRGESTSGSDQRDDRFEQEKTLIIGCARLGLYDVDYILSRNYWELEAVKEGLRLSQVDRREELAELALNVRYTVHAKKVKVKKLFDKEREERRVRGQLRQVKREDLEFAKRVKLANDHFRNKFKQDDN